MSATRSLFERRDCVIVASVSCIYGLGSPEAYYGMLLMLEKGQKIKREELVKGLVKILYQRRDGELDRGKFRVVGDGIELYPTYDDYAYRIELWGDEIDSLSQIDPLLGQTKQVYERLPIYPASHYVMSDEQRDNAIGTILEELDWWTGELHKQGKVLEAQRLSQRTQFDIEMMRSIGYCHGIENYSRHFSGRLPGEPPPTLLDYLPGDALVFIDESHQTTPQIHGMYHGDRSRKENLVAHGFRLPSALDNRPLTFEEFEHRVNRSSTFPPRPAPMSSRSPPAWWPSRSCGRRVWWIPRWRCGRCAAGGRPVARDTGQGGGGRAGAGDHADQAHVRGSGRVLRRGRGQCRYLHSEIDTLERVTLLRDLRRGSLTC